MLTQVNLLNLLPSYEIMIFLSIEKENQNKLSKSISNQSNVE